MAETHTKLHGYRRKTNEEIYVEATANSNNGVELKTYLYNKSGWPARVCDKLSFRYFMDLTEYVSAGYNPNDITVSIITVQHQLQKFQTNTL